jgi:hypothetical protein
MTDEQVAKEVVRMSTRDAVWLMKASMLPGVWTTINMGLMGWQLEHRGMIELRGPAVTTALARPTELGRAVAELYCEMSGLEFDVPESGAHE